MTAPRAKYGKRSSAAFELTSEQRQHLLAGTFYFPNSGFVDPATFREAWRIHRVELTDIWLCDWRPKWFEPCGFLRPFAWWFCTHRQERPVVAKLTPDEIRACRAAAADEHFGFLHTSAFRSFDGGETVEYLQESERDYLSRLNLLSREEKQFLAEFDALEEADETD